MQPQAPQLGIYQVLNAYYETHNGKLTPIADVIFKGVGWTKFDYTPLKLRLRGLYNKSSVGPKDQFRQDNIQSLYLHLISITNKIEHADPKDSTKMIYSLEWEAMKPSNYDELIQQDIEQEGDFILQQQADDIHDAELLVIEMEELIALQNLEAELGLSDEEDSNQDSCEDDFT
ncbi:MAG TPA: hypothetical protein VKB19_12045 [Pedobacter sp.]|nr:hypothetical protein [Pedobacter sp.]